nr:MAG TPA: IrrE protein [Caudoviricetes sp.]
MSTREELECIAEDEDITVLNTDCPECGSISLMTPDGSCYIGLDNKEMTKAEELVHMAHELGHCVTGSFYNRYAKFDIISKHEQSANKWAVKKLIPEDELIAAFECGIMEIWELAEHFGVTEDFMIFACEFYGYYHRAI